ncbi:hypothetical protein Bca4012_065380 [Brassica carinata]
MYEEARDITYAEMPTRFTWNRKERVRKPRKRSFAIGRIAHISNKIEELYYLRILLNYVKGPQSFEDIRTMEGVTYETFKEACEVLGLFDDDKEYILSIEEASHWSFGYYLRRFFVIMFISDCLTEPELVNTASSGIAALLLEGGRTAHSRFNIQMNLDETTSCKISPDSDLARLLRLADLIVWDEAPMMSRHCFENLDRTLCDIIRTKKHKPFGGKVIVFGGDFRQILPVIPYGGRTETLMASLKRPYIWEHCKVLRLTRNMRLLSGRTDKESEELRLFSEWILAVGDGNINNPNDGIVDIDIPEDLLIKECDDPISLIVKEVYRGSADGVSDKESFSEKGQLFVLQMKTSIR